MRASVPTLSLRGGTPEARVLAFACLCAGLLSWWTALVPFSPTAPTRVAGVLGLVGSLLAGLLWVVREHAPHWLLHAVVVLGWLSVSGCVAASTTANGAVATAFSYVWVAMYTAWFHRTRAAVLHLLGMAVGLAVALRLCHEPSAGQTWTFVVGSVGGVAATLHRLVRRLRDLAERDSLTGLPNRAAFTAAAERAIAVADRDRQPVTVALVDLDGFKQVNDRDGHAAGDRLLRELAGSWQQVLRGGDLLARYGGDEFVLLMPATTETGAKEALDRLAAGSAASRWTAGVAQWEGEPLAAWLARADADLYARKGVRDGQRT